MNSSDRLEQIVESPKELAHFLLQHKKVRKLYLCQILRKSYMLVVSHDGMYHLIFTLRQNDVSETAQFLLQALDQLPGMDKISADLINDSKTEDCEHAEEDDPRHGLVELPLPRDGRHLNAPTSLPLLLASTARTREARGGSCSIAS